MIRFIGVCPFCLTVFIYDYSAEADGRSIPHRLRIEHRFFDQTEETRNKKGRSLLEQKRYLVQIRCKACGERFVLKGSLKKGKVETGFKQCLCDNTTAFEVTTEKL
jgi:ArsR family metal-binding transcriptional regulator